MRIGPPSPRRAGIILVLLSGAVGLLVLLALLVLQLCRTRAKETAALAAARGAFLSAESGMEYAASRLAREPTYPRFDGTSADRGDDWAFRDGFNVPLESARNVSYAHGDAWREGGVPDGRYTPVADAFDPARDRDGDGRFGSWSGRVRGEARAIPFSLRVGSTEGGIPLNLGGSAPYRAALHEHVLNNLGVATRPAAAAPAAGWTRLEEVQAGGFASGNPGEPILLSRLGYDLILRRPPGGYRTVEEVRKALAFSGYRADEADLFLPHLDVGPYEILPEYRRVPDDVPRPDDDQALYAPICLATASRETLQSLWMHLISRSTVPRIPQLAGTAEGWGVPCSWTGSPSGGGTLPFAGTQLCIRPEEAGRLADLAIALRRAGIYSWGALREAFAANAASVFEKDALDLAGYPLNQRSWIQAKAELAWQAVSMDPFNMKWSYNTDPIVPSITWANGGIDRGGEPGQQPCWGIRFAKIGRITYPPTFPAFPTPPASPWKGASFNPFTPYRNWGQEIAPQGLSMAPPCRFRVACDARLGPSRFRLEASLRASERLVFTSQEDFECLSGAPALARLGILAADDPSPAARRDGLGGPPKIASLPRWSRRSSAPAAYGTRPGYSRNAGALSLAPYKGGISGAQVYLPFTEDFDGSSANDFWTVCAPGFTQVQAQVNVGADCVHAHPFGFGGHQVWPSAPPWFQCPGMEGPSTEGNTIRSFTLESWMGPSSQIYLITGYRSYGCTLTLTTRRGVSGSAKEATYYRLDVSWFAPLSGCGAISTSALFEIEDDEQTLTGDAPRPSWGSHVVLAMERLGAGTPGDRYRSLFHLYVNGRDHPTGIPMTLAHQWRNAMGEIVGDMQVTDREQIQNNYGGGALGTIDEIRLYRATLDQAEAHALYSRHRYFRKGTYTSPRYVFDAPARIAEAQWHGVVPYRLGVEPFRVSATGYLDAAGTAPVLPPADLSEAGGDRALRLDGLGEIRSFRYGVTIDATDATGVLNETPFFESIWLAVQRRGVAPAWSGWGIR